MSWKKKFEALEIFVKAHGHARVPSKYKPNLPLGQWVGFIRSGKARLSPKDLQRLNALGFVWKPYESRWKERLAQLKRFKEQHGHAKVPSAWQKNPPLTHFCNKMRAKIRRGTLPKEKLEQLRGLGFA